MKKSTGSIAISFDETTNTVTNGSDIRSVAELETLAKSGTPISILELAQAATREHVAPTGKVAKAKKALAKVATIVSEKEVVTPTGETVIETKIIIAPKKATKLNKAKRTDVQPDQPNTTVIAPILLEGNKIIRNSAGLIIYHPDFFLSSGEMMSDEQARENGLSLEPATIPVNVKITLEANGQLKDYQSTAVDNLLSEIDGISRASDLPANEPTDVFADEEPTTDIDGKIELDNRGFEQFGPSQGDTPENNETTIYQVQTQNWVGEQTSKLTTGLDWQVVNTPIYNPEGKIIDGHQHLTRSDNGKTLYVGQSSYHHTPNSKFTDTVKQMQDITGYSLEGFDEWRGGKTLLAYLKVTNPFTIDGHRFDDYLTIGNSHDGTSSFFFGSTNRMIRCMNDFSAILQSMKIRHTKNHLFSIDELTEKFADFSEFKKDLVFTLDEMRQVEIDETIKAQLLERVFGFESEEILGNRSDMNGLKRKNLEEIEASLSREMGDLGNNLFGLFNGVTHYTTHVKKQKERAFGNIAGSVFDMNNNAYQFAIDVLDELMPSDN